MERAAKVGQANRPRSLFFLSPLLGTNVRPPAFGERDEIRFSRHRSPKCQTPPFTAARHAVHGLA